MIEWQTLTKKHMPPTGCRFLLYMDALGSGGFAAFGRAKRDKDGATSVYQQKQDGVVQYELIDPAAYRTIRWAAIDPPACARKRGGTP